MNCVDLFCIIDQTKQIFRNIFYKVGEKYDHLFKCRKNC